jgi:hypothetical protein
MVEPALAIGFYGVLGQFSILNEIRERYSVMKKKTNSNEILLQSKKYSRPSGTLTTEESPATISIPCKKICP